MFVLVLFGFCFDFGFVGLRKRRDDLLIEMKTGRGRLGGSDCSSGGVRVLDITLGGNAFPAAGDQCQDGPARMIPNQGMKHVGQWQYFEVRVCTWAQLDHIKFC